MSKKFFVKNHTPIVETKIFSKDKKDSCIVAFDRYSRTELAKIFESYGEMAQDETYTESLMNFTKSKIKYLKDVALTSFEFDEDGESIEGSETTLIVDTRTSENEAWKNPAECKEFILNILFDSFSWGGDIFMSAFNDHISNITGQGKEEEVKN